MKVISVKFKENGRSYYFDPCDFEIKEGDYVIVTTARGTECGEVVRASHEVPGFSREVKPVIRVADAVDIRRMRQNRADVQQAYTICEQRIAAHEPGNEAGGCGIYLRQQQNPVLLHRRRPGGFPRAGQGPGLGVPHPHRAAADRRARREPRCWAAWASAASPFCCCHFLEDFQPVSIKMAKEQGLSLNPTKISGSLRPPDVLFGL